MGCILMAGEVYQVPADFDFTKMDKYNLCKMSLAEKEAAYQCLLKLRGIPVSVRLSDDQEKAYIEWHGSEERRQMLEAAITSLTEGTDPPPYNIYENRVVDVVNHPPHYQGKKFESIDIIEDFELGFHLGNAIKYILRAGKKGNKIQDLKKAIWYLERECVIAVAETADSGLGTKGLKLEE